MRRNSSGGDYHMTGSQWEDQIIWNIWKRLVEVENISNMLLSLLSIVGVMPGRGREMANQAIRNIRTGGNR